MNAQKGKDGNNKFHVHNKPKRNGEYVADFSLENRLACLNTKFKKREGNQWTYSYQNNSKAQLDIYKQEVEKQHLKL